ncbi:hypothetical protein [Clostridium sulfidigenes]
MKPIFRQTQLFTFLLYCNDVELEKKVLQLKRFIGYCLKVD